MKVINGLHVAEEDVLHSIQRLGSSRADHRSDVVLQGVDTTMNYSTLHFEHIHVIAV